MADMNKWEKGHKLLPEEEADYLKDLCAYMREQQTLSEPKRQEGDGENAGWVCEVVPDEIAAHAADIIEELFDRVQKLQYELKEAKNV
jgi:hypothetical protein